jgi:aspartate aminotransferase-like enzyme
MSRPGRHFLQIPGPTNVPDRVLRAMDNPTMDHRGPDFAKLGKRALDGMKRIVKTEAGQVVIYPASGTGAWEAALVNTLSPGDKLVMFETGHFAWLWEKLARRILVLSRRLCGPIPRMRSKQSAWCRTRHRPARPPASEKYERRLMPPVTPHF